MYTDIFFLTLQLLQCVNPGGGFFLQPVNGIPIQIFSIQHYWTTEHQRIAFSQIISPDDWFPIEINVPDTIMSAWQGVELAWMAASEYFSSNNE